MRLKNRTPPPPKKTLPINDQLASPVTEWGAPGAFTRRYQLFPEDDVPEKTRRDSDSGSRGNVTIYSSYT